MGEFEHRRAHRGDDRRHIRRLHSHMRCRVEKIQRSGTNSFERYFFKKKIRNDDDGDDVNDDDVVHLIIKKNRNRKLRYDLTKTIFYLLIFFFVLRVCAWQMTSFTINQEWDHRLWIKDDLIFVTNSGT